MNRRPVGDACRSLVVGQRLLVGLDGNIVGKHADPQFADAGNAHEAGFDPHRQQQNRQVVIELRGQLPRASRQHQLANAIRQLCARVGERVAAALDRVLQSCDRLLDLRCSRDARIAGAASLGESGLQRPQSIAIRVEDVVGREHGLP